MNIRAVLLLAIGVLPLVSSMRMDTESSACTTLPFGVKIGKCCTPRCNGRDGHKERTRLQGAILSNCEFVIEGPFKVKNAIGKYFEPDSEWMNSYVWKQRDGGALPKFPESDYICHERCNAKWPETTLRNYSQRLPLIDVYRSGGVDTEDDNECLSIHYMKLVWRPDLPKVTTSTKKPSLWNRISQKGKK